VQGCKHGPGISYSSYLFYLPVVLTFMFRKEA
jgi:hypothetical protein